MKAHHLLSLTLVFSLALITSCSKNGDSPHSSNFATTPPQENTSESASLISNEPKNNISNPENATTLNICARGTAISNAVTKALNAESCETVSIKDMANLRTLDLHTEASWANQLQIDKISANTFEGLTSLEELDLSGNLIESIDEETFKNLSSLKILNLSRNKINSLINNAFQSLASIEILDLGHNYITNIPAKIFDGLATLNSLNLSGNSIGSLEQLSLKGLSNLITLNLSKNKVGKRGLRALSSLLRRDNFEELILDKAESILPDDFSSSLTKKIVWRE